MNDENKHLEREAIGLRILWMVIFAIVWQLAEIVLALVVVIQLGYRLFYGAANGSLQGFGDSLSQYLQQIGRYGTFNSEKKPWPFADWPVPQAPEDNEPHSIPATAHPVRDEEPKL